MNSFQNKKILKKTELGVTLSSAKMMRLAMRNLLLLVLYAGLLTYSIYTFVVILQSESLSAFKKASNPASTAFARTFASQIRLSLAISLLTSCRATWTCIGDMTGVDASANTVHIHAGVVLLIASIGHSISHYVNFILLHTHHVMHLRSSFLHRASITGHVLLLLIALIAVSSFMRRLMQWECFEVLHWLIIPFTVITCIHGIFCFIRANDWSCIKATAWMWVVGPAVLCVLDWCWRCWRVRKKINLLKLIRHSGGIIELHFQAPCLRYRAGQYILLRRQGSVQWHPFTLTSAPEDLNPSVHVRICGDWTKDLAKSLGVNGDHDYVAPVKFPWFRIDGPFGTPSQAYHRYKRILLIGAGIGQTPFASILRSLWYRRSGERHVTYIGIMRQPQPFEWFFDVLRVLESSQDNMRLDISLWITGSMNAERVKVLYHLNDATVDPLTGLNARTSFGRPPLKKILEDESTSNEWVAVFYCGPKALANQICRYCGSLGLHFYRERF